MKRHIVSLGLVLPAVFLLTGCASVVSGTGQSVTVFTPPVSGAHCHLSNDKGEWYVGSTPETVKVHRSNKPLHTVCSKAGYYDAEKIVGSSANGAAFGNIALGGIVGAGVDMADGAAFSYNTKIMVPMSKVRHVKTIAKSRN